MKNYYNADEIIIGSKWALADGTFGYVTVKKVENDTVYYTHTDGYGVTRSQVYDKSVFNFNVRYTYIPPTNESD